MKVLQITPHFSPNIGGVETHVEDLAIALSVRKHNVFVLTYSPLQTEASWKVYEKRNGFKILRIPWFPGLFYKLVNFPVFEFLYLFPGIFLVTPFIILSQTPDVLHAHGLVAAVSAIFWGKVFGIRKVISTHNIYNLPRQGLFRKFVQWIFKNVDFTLCLSHQSFEEIREITSDNINKAIFTSWVDLKKFSSQGSKIQLKNKLKWPKKFTTLFVGRLVSEKGIKELCQAAIEWDKNINLVIIGTGTLEKDIKEISIKNKNILYLGKINNRQLPFYYSAVDLVIVPSTHEEGFGRVILEALACGTPVIGSNKGAIPDVMNDTVGKLIDITPQNIKKWVEYFYRNPQKLNLVSKKTREFVKNKYSDKNVETIIKSYIKE